MKAARKGAGGMSLEDIEELCRHLTSTKTSLETLRADHEVLLVENAAMKARQGQMADLIEELERSVLHLNEELTESENLVEQTTFDLEQVAKYNEELERSLSNHHGQGALLEQDMEEQTGSLRMQLARVRERCKEQAEVLRDYETTMERQDDYIFSLNTRMDRLNSKSPQRTPQRAQAPGNGTPGTGGSTGSGGKGKGKGRGRAVRPKPTRVDRDGSRSLIDSDLDLDSDPGTGTGTGAAAAAAGARNSNVVVTSGGGGGVNPGGGPGGPPLVMIAAREAALRQQEREQGQGEGHREGRVYIARDHEIHRITCSLSS